METSVTNFEFPTHFDCPKKMPRTAKYVGGVEWAWSPGHSRQDLYYLSTNRSRTHWILWFGYFDDYDTHRWEHLPYAFGPKIGVSDKDAACELILAGWTNEIKNGDVDQFHFVVSEGLLSLDDMLKIAECVWVDEASSRRRQALKERELQN